MSNSFIFAIDGEVYDIRVLSIKRSMTTQEKYRITTADGTKHREVKGHYMSYELTFDSAFYDEEEYNKIVSKVLEGKSTYDVSIMEIDGIISFEAFLSISEDTCERVTEDKAIFTGAKLKIEATNLYKAVAPEPEPPEPTSVVVQFDLNGGTAVPELTAQVIETGTRISEPTNVLTKDGFDFNYWKELGDTKAFDFGLAINQNTTLVAEWSQVQHLKYLPLPIAPLTEKVEVI